MLGLAAWAAGSAGGGEARDLLDGVWESDGFGYAFAIQGRTLKAFEVTATTCVESFTARRQRAYRPPETVAFRSGEEVYHFRRGQEPGVWLVRPAEAIADITIRRAQRLPHVCDQPTADSPQGNFEVFAQTWAEHYVAFEQRSVDWKAVVAEYRPQVKAATTPGELFELLRTMIERFADLHTYVSAPALRQSTRRFGRPGTDRIIGGDLEEFSNRGRWQLFSRIDRLNLSRDAKQLCNGGLHYGDLGDGLGYLRIRSLGNYAKSNEAGALEKCLDAIFGGWKIRSLVLDVRLAFGGSDELGLAIASRLTAEPYVAYTIQSRARGGAGWTARQPMVVQPSPRAGFRGPIAVLTGPVTLSAAESLVLALMARRPLVTRIGESTQGVFCDVLSRRLPNGWSFGLPNSVYATDGGKTFDASGIPPHIAVAVFDDADLRAGRDPAMEAARRVLAQPGGRNP